jgi:hypothetical protein
MLADAQARMLRSLFAAEAAELSAGFTSQLKVFLEHHIGLRVFYPEIERFYRDVQSGRIEDPLPLDAVEGFLEAVRSHTPSVFDPTISDNLEGSAQAPPPIGQPSSASLLPVDESHPVPPKDPLGDLAPRKAWDFTVAGAVNGLWKAFLTGEKTYKAFEGWRSAGEALAPTVAKILEWLQHFQGGGTPPPPTLGT